MPASCTCNLAVLALAADVRGYRGCLIDDAAYVFFTYTRKGRLRRLKSYPRSDFEDDDHFTAMMRKYLVPSVFLKPPVPIEALTLAELDRVQAIIRNSRRTTDEI
jgi:hypothetical protein